MLPDFIRHPLTLNMEIVAMVAEEIQQRAEYFVQTHSDEAYEAYLNQMINQIEKTVDTLATPFEQVMKMVQDLRPEHSSNSPLNLNWQDAFQTLNSRIQELKKNLPS
ncbi:MAG: hypothetical protein IGS03_13750 [Candidatus Sericytochromatia bacterium]|nr:hypothetical protein [Candidatus Sericytochromatia bacterium]